MNNLKEISKQFNLENFESSTKTKENRNVFNGNQKNVLNKFEHDLIKNFNFEIYLREKSFNNTQMMTTKTVPIFSKK